MGSGKGTRAPWLAVLLCLVLVAGACGGDDDDGAEAGSGENTEEAEETETETGDSQAAGGEITEGGTLVFGADQDFGGFNTGLSKNNQLAASLVMRHIWSSGYRVRPDFTLEPWILAKEAEVVSEAPFTVEWTLRDNAMWSDGTPVTSSDMEFAALVCNGKNEEADCVSTSGYDLITKLTKPTDKTIRAEFSQVYSDYEGLMGTFPSHIIKRDFGEGIANMVKGWNEGFQDSPGASNGPFTLATRERGVSLTLERNDTFWGSKPHLDRIIFRFLPDSGSQITALDNAEVDMINPQPQLDQVSTVEEMADVNSIIGFGPTFEHLTFNFENEFLAIPEVRQAIALGVDRQAIVNRLMKPFSEKASTLGNRIIVSTQAGYEAHGQEYARADVEKAQALLEEAGFEKSGTYYEKDGKELELRLSTTAGNALRERQGVFIQAQLKRIGINIRIDNSSPPDLFNKRLPDGDFDIANFAWVGSVFPAPAVKQIYGTGSDSNYSNYSNPRVDELGLKALATVDETEKLAVLNQIDELLWEGLPNLPLYQKPTFLAYSEKFANIEDNTTNESPFWNSEEWAVRARAQ
ncbi:MAG: ABC transporter family substrate-binding protein [Acidimicrobiia bacterium]